MTTMLEKAVGAANDVLSLALIGPEDDLFLGDVVARNMVRAALQAIREPSSAMVHEGYHHFADPCGPEDAARGFTAMIDAILNEKSGDTT